MSNDGFFGMMKFDGKEALYRVGATQTVALVKAALVKAIQLKAGDNPQLQMLSLVLDSEIGETIIGLLLGYSLPFTPGIKEDARIQKLCEEIRVNSFATGGNALVDLVADQLKPILANALANIPAEEESVETGLRVVHSETNSEQVEEEAPVAKKRTSAAHR